MKPILEVRGISKKFKIKHQSESYLSLRDSLMGIFNQGKNSKEEFWALKDVSFEVNAGDSIGIIGRNGAGKSTLLKILSKITPPSSGKIISRGRIASLLEVGTGFHPELTGRENIYLNGSILGLKHNEINKQFDAIVSFSGVEKFLDTPLKHYSSGMQLRLAFAVAAHLEPEILIIDEVLAVGDAEFQKKCIGKMDEVSKSGRTILFVSHQLGTISQLCKKGILIEKGVVKEIGNISNVINSYVQSQKNAVDFFTLSKNKEVYFESFKILNSFNEPCDTFLFDENLLLDIVVKNNKIDIGLKFTLTIQNKWGDYLSTIIEDLNNFKKIDNETLSMRIELPSGIIAPNYYYFRLAIFKVDGKIFDLHEMISPIKIQDSGTSLSAFEGTDYGYFIMNYKVII